MFAKKNRLAKTNDIRLVYARGRAFFSPSFTLKFIRKMEGGSRFTVVVSTKVSKKATVRNAVKRHLREVFKTHLHALKVGDYILTVKPGAVKMQLLSLRAELEQLIMKTKLLEIKQ